MVGQKYTRLVDLDWRASERRVERPRHPSVNPTPASRNHINNKLPCQIWLEINLRAPVKISKVVPISQFSMSQLSHHLPFLVLLAIMLSSTRATINLEDIDLAAIQANSKNISKKLSSR